MKQTPHTVHKVTTTFSTYMYEPRHTLGVLNRWLNIGKPRQRAVGVHNPTRTCVHVSTATCNLPATRPRPCSTTRDRSKYSVWLRCGRNRTSYDQLPCGRDCTIAQQASCDTQWQRSNKRVRVQNDDNASPGEWRGYQHGGATKPRKGLPCTRKHPPLHIILVPLPKGQGWGKTSF